MPLQATSGAASYDAFGGGVPVVPNYIEDVFSTWLYAGNGSTQTITNGIDLSGKGGLVWQKTRSVGTTNHVLCDTARGVNAFLFSNDTLSSINNGGTDAVYSYNANGFSTGTVNGADINLSGETAVSWTFRKQPKFFDVVTWTGTGSNTTISHSLGSVPACIMVKRTDTTSNWQVYHRSLANTEYLVLNTTAAKATGATRWNSTTPTSTVFSLGTDATVNASGGTYVAYLFAHDAGGFGLTGTDNVISCGSLTADSSGNSTVTLGYEPQWVMTKRSDGVGDWRISDIMRGMSQTTNFSLRPNLSNAEQDLGAGAVKPTSTGFTTDSNITNANQTYIYVAIRRGPMAVPTIGTSVFAPYVTSTVAASASGSTSTSALYRSDFVTDFIIQTAKASVESRYALTRLTGTKYLVTNTTAAEVTTTAPFDSNIAALNFAADYGQWMFRRAPSFMDVVCYTGTGSATTFSHNLAAVPELMIIKSRSRTAENWPTYAAPVFVPGAGYTTGRLNDSIDFQLNNALFNNARPTASVFSVGVDTSVNFSGSTYVAYLFATCAGVSKVGSYTGTGALQTVNCGFTSGARFVLIKRTDSTGDWYVYDSARGISSGNDPYLFLNSTAAEVTNTNYVDTDTTGFKVTAAAPAGLNASGGTYIFLAIA